METSTSTISATTFTASPVPTGLAKQELYAQFIASNGIKAVQFIPLKPV